MSQSLNQEDEAKTSSLEKANATFGDMMLRGRSYSGRERNCVFLNTKERFANISASSGIDLPDDGRALIATDWDHDGDLDVFISNRNAPRVRFFRNEVPSDHHHLSLSLEGTAPGTNRDAIGARVEVNLKEGLPLIKTLRAGESFLSQSSKSLHFGLGEVAAITSVLVQWPGGESETFTEFEADHRYRLVQGSGKPEKLERKERDLKIADTPVELPGSEGAARIPLVTLLPMADLKYQTFEGQEKSLSFGKGKAKVLVLWASWCPPCEAELEELVARKNELDEAGLEIIALAVDGLEDNKPAAPEAQELAQKLKLSFVHGRATREIINYLQSAHDYLIAGSETLPVPVGFLVDESGKISVIYKGRLDLDQLKQDREHSMGTRLERFARSASLPGRALPIETASCMRNQYEAQYRFATFLQQRGHTALARAENMSLIEAFPKNAGPHNNLGISYIRSREMVLAEASFRSALQVDPKHSQANANLGRILAKQGKLPEAVLHLQKAVAGNPQDGKTLAILGGLLLKMERWPEAQRTLETALESGESSADLYVNLGFVLAQQGQFQEAVTALEKALVIQPNHQSAQRNLMAVRRLMSEAK